MSTLTMPLDEAHAFIFYLIRKGIIFVADARENVVTITFTGGY